MEDFKCSGETSMFGSEARLRTVKDIVSLQTLPELFVDHLFVSFGETQHSKSDVGL